MYVNLIVYWRTLCIKSWQGILPKKKKIILVIAKSLRGPWIKVSGKEEKKNNNTGLKLWKTGELENCGPNPPVWRWASAKHSTDLVTLEQPVRAPTDGSRFHSSCHRIVVTVPGQIAHESVDTGANAQPSTGRYTRSHSTVLDVFNNIGDRTATTCWSALHTDTDRPATVDATHNGTIERGPSCTLGNLRGSFTVVFPPFSYQTSDRRTRYHGPAVRQCVSFAGDRWPR